MPRPAQENNKLNRRLTCLAISVLLSLPALAEDRITREQIQQVIKATDTAALDRDAAGIAMHLGVAFERTIEFVYQDLMAKVRLDRDEYLAMIDEGWQGISDYDYQRADTAIHISPDGLSGMSYSTVTENMVQDGVKMTSRFREHATYALENGRPVITRVGGHTLLGDTTPN